MNEIDLIFEEDKYHERIWIGIKGIITSILVLINALIFAIFFPTSDSLLINILSTIAIILFAFVLFIFSLYYFNYNVEIIKGIEDKIKLIKDREKKELLLRKQEQLRIEHEKLLRIERELDKIYNKYNSFDHFNDK